MASADRSILLVLLAAGVLSSACAPRATPPESPDFVLELRAASCPGFTVGEATVTIEPAGRTVELAGGHRLDFAPNAVAEPSTYRIRQGRAGWAEILIEPQQGAPSEFAADVFLELSYAACPELGNGRLVLMKTSAPQKSLGGRNDTQRRVLRTLIPHLTAFAMAR